MADAKVSHDDDGVFVRPISFLTGSLEFSRAGVKGLLTLAFDVYVLFRVGLDLERPVIPGLPITITLHLTPFDLCGQRYKKSHVLLPHHAPEVLRGG